MPLSLIPRRAMGIERPSWTDFVLTIDRSHLPAIIRGALRFFNSLSYQERDRLMPRTALLLVASLVFGGFACTAYAAPPK